jgi:hypothetical protein
MKLFIHVLTLFEIVDSFGISKLMYVCLSRCPVIVMKI